MQRVNGWLSNYLPALLAICSTIGVAVYLALKPSEYTSLVQFLISIILGWVFYKMGQNHEKDSAAKIECEKMKSAARMASDRWLPQAESVMYRLMTLKTNVCGFSRLTKSSCATISCDLPELADPSMRAARIKMKADCEASSTRLDDIALQLEDAIEDWRRFVDANCLGEECARIYEALMAREQRLDRAYPELAFAPPGLGVQGTPQAQPMGA